MAEITGSRVRRVDEPEPGLLCLTLSRPGEREVLLVATTPPGGVGLVPERPRGAPASAFVQRLRRSIGNAVLEGVDAPDPRTLRVRVRRGEVARSLVVVAAASLVAIVEEERVVAVNDPRALRQVGRTLGGAWPLGPVADPHDAAALRQAGARLLDERVERGDDGRRRDLVRALRRARDRRRRKVRAIEADASRVDDVDDLRRDARVLVASLHRLGPRDERVTGTDWEADPPAERTVAIDLALGAQAQAERMFHRARRLERGAKIAAERLAIARAELDELEALLTAAEESPAEALGGIAERAQRAGVRTSAATSGRRAAAAPRTPFRRFLSAGRPILVGRGAADNDELTTRHARPHDLWLHARGRRGAHVVVPLERGKACPPDLLVDACTLAAHFSEAAGEELVEVQYAERRHVRKPKRLPPGAVLVEREKVMTLRLSRERLAALLAAETAP